MLEFSNQTENAKCLVLDLAQQALSFPPFNGLLLPDLDALTNQEVSHKQ